MWYLLCETIFMTKFLVFCLFRDIPVFLKSKEVIGLLQYQVLPYEWKENSSVSLRARATLNRRERDALIDTHMKLTTSSFSHPSLRNRNKKY